MAFGLAVNAAKVGGHRFAGSAYFPGTIRGCGWCGLKLRWPSLEFHRQLLLRSRRLRRGFSRPAARLDFAPLARRAFDAGEKPGIPQGLPLIQRHADIAYRLGIRIKGARLELN
ncbi:MAG: hypothetical protein U1A72_20550 [Sulfuritalea sp.]|nr:hypothetical protein [Sulfuritalea sp.]